MIRALGIGLMMAGALTFLFPGFNGILFEGTTLTPGEGQILTAVLCVGGLILLALAGSGKITR